MAVEGVMKRDANAVGNTSFHSITCRLGPNPMECSLFSVEYATTKR